MRIKIAESIFSFLVAIFSLWAFAQDQGQQTQTQGQASEPEISAQEAEAPITTDPVAEQSAAAPSAPVPPPAPSSQASGRAANVEGVDFKYVPGQSELVLKFDRDVEFNKSVLEQDNQVVLEIRNAKISRKFARKLDTSSFRSNVSIISPYQANGEVRVVLQLKSKGDVDVVPDGKNLLVRIDNKDGGVAVTESQAESANDVGSEPSPEATAAAPTNAGDALGQFFESQSTNKYVGKRISLQVREAEIQDIFRAISEASEFNIVLGDEVKGKVSLNLVDVPWDQALDILLHSQKLAAERNGNILRVTTMSNLTKEKQAEITAKRAAEAAEPLVVKIFPISYAKLDDLKKILEDFLSREFNANLEDAPPPGIGLQALPQLAQAQQQSASSGASKRGSIQIDSRTRSIVVRDTPSTIEKIKRIIKELDTQTPQVMIEAKFVEVKEGSTRNIQGRIFATSREFDATSNSLTFRNTNNNFGTLFGGSQFGTAGLPTNFAVTPVAGASFGFSPRAGLIPGLNEIAALISILESEQQVKVIASPRIVTQNQEPAEISQGNVIQVPTIAGANAAGGFITVNAVLKLTVTPHVTNDGNITLKVNFSQEAPSAQQVGAAGSLTTDSKKVDTTVLVDSGSTLVIGGIYSSTENTSEAGIPILRDIPLIGPFFGSREKSTSKSELFIFITPRVINEKETGLKG